MIVHVLVHETDGVMGVHRTPEGAMEAIHTVDKTAWKHFPSLAAWKGGPYQILEETVKP